MNDILFIIIWLIGSLVSYPLFRKFAKGESNEYYSIGDRFWNIVVSLGFSWISVFTGLLLVVICATQDSRFFSKRAKW